MSEAISTENFYPGVPVFRSFANVADQECYLPLPGDWLIGIADVVDSTKAVQAKRYKAVNMAGAAVIVAITNALEHREFPFVFGGDGASFAVPPSAAWIAREALAATATWVKEELNLTLRTGLVRVATARQQGADVRVARFAASDNIALAMFSGGGLAWADAAIKQGRVHRTAAPPGTRPDLSGLSCRFEEIPAVRGLILSLLVMPAVGATSADVRQVFEAVIRFTERNPDASGPVPNRNCRAAMAAAGARPRSRAQRRAGESLPGARPSCWCGPSSVPDHALQHQGRPLLAEKIRQGAGREFRLPQVRRHAAHGDRLHARRSPTRSNDFSKAAAAAGTVRFGLHRQDRAMMTCFTPSPIHANHVHFIDGALGGYTTAATAMKAS